MWTKMIKKIIRFGVRMKSGHCSDSGSSVTYGHCSEAPSRKTYSGHCY